MAAKGYFTVRLRNPLLRLGLCAMVVAVAAICAVSVVRHAVADSVLYLSTRMPLPTTALERAYALEPDNPEASYRLAVFSMDVAQPPDLDKAGRLLDESLRLAPNRVPSWLALGRRFELQDHPADAEQAYLRAASLAPSFWRPQWALGNLYIRQDRVAEGIEALGRASDRNTETIALAIRTAWQATDGDYASASRAAGGSLRGRSDLLEFLIQQQKTDEALATWTDLAGAYPDAPAVAGLGRAVASLLLTAGRIDDALRIWGRLTPGSAPGLEQVQNPGFDDPIAERADSPFAWTITQAPEAHVSLDVGRSSGKALRVDYKVKGGAALSHASEFVRVRPGVAYVLSFWAKTDDLQSGGLPFVAVGDAANREPGTASRLLPAGTSDWTPYRVEFRAPSSGLVAIGLGRASCGDLCPIYGTIWIDDIALAAR